MYKIILICLITFIAILGISLQDVLSLSLPQSIIHITNGTLTPFMKFFSDSKEYQHCLENTSSCSPIINVIYESPTTLILKSHSMNTLWKAVDKVKKSGYDIAGVTYLPNSNTTNSETSFDLLVVMSQNSVHSHQK